MMASARESAPRERQETFFGALAHLREEVDERGIEQGWIAGLLADGVDPAFSHRLGMDHGIMTVLQELDPQHRTRLVPIVQNCAVPPLPWRRGSPVGASPNFPELLVTLVASGRNMGQKSRNAGIFSRIAG